MIVIMRQAIQNTVDMTGYKDGWTVGNNGCAVESEKKKRGVDRNVEDDGE
jgi:hypothetical protein